MVANDENLTIEPAPFTRAQARTGRRRLRLKPLPVTLGVIFVVLAVAVTFMFSARAVRFNIEPLPESLTFVDGMFTYRLGERYLMLPGDYRIRATLSGYEPLEVDVRVGKEEDQDFSFTLQKLPGILTIKTDPDVPSEVYIDQVNVGISPLTLESVPAGLHDIRIVPERYLPVDTEIEIEGKRTEQALSLPLEPAWAEVSLSSLPAEAAIVVDGEERGKTPAVIEILQGARQIQLKKPGYKTWQTSLAVVAGEPQAVSQVRLARSDGKINVTTEPPGANVTIGGRYRGQSPLEVSLAPGTSYNILLSKVGYQSVERTLAVEPEQDIALNTRLTPILGVLRLRVKPEGGELFVDGQSVGEPSRRLSLTVRSHRLRIVKAGYAPFETTVTPQPGLAQQLMIQLETEEEARVAAIPDMITTSAGNELKLIIPDRLKMGASRREPGRRSNEIEKTVILTRPYYLGVHEITNGQFKQFNPGHESGMLGRAVLGDDERPVVNVTWIEAVQFCNWLSNKDGLEPAYEFSGGSWHAVEPMTTGYRLPTEAEWAWAARYASGPEPTRFPWGDTMPPPAVTANYADESARNMVPYIIGGYNDTYRGPAPVGSFPANEFGIYDLAGNVSEWIHDYYSTAPITETLTEPMGPATGQYHVIRGSNYTHGRFSELRWTFRDYGIKASPEVGFRIARYVE